MTRAQWAQDQAAILASLGEQKKRLAQVEETLRAERQGLDDVFAHGMLSMAHLGRLLTNVAPQQQLRSFQVRFAAITTVHGQPTCTGTVTSIEEVDGERRATLDLKVALADGTVTLLGNAVIALD